MYVNSRKKLILGLVNFIILKGDINSIILLVRRVEKFGFLDIEFEVCKLKSLVNLAKYISFYSGYLHIYSNDSRFQEQVRDIIKNENNTYVSKEDRDNIIKLFKTLLSRTIRDDLDNKYTNESILGKDLLNKFFTGEYREVPTLVNSSKRIVKKKLESKNEIYLEIVKEQLPKTLQIDLRIHCNESNDSLSEEDKIKKFVLESLYKEDLSQGR